MAQGQYTPLQLTAAAGLLNNQGLLPLPQALRTALNSFNSTTVMANFFAAVSFYKAQAFANQTTLNRLLSIGNTVCPALGNSVPTSPVGSYPSLDSAYYVDYLTPSIDGSTLDPSGLSIFMEQLGNAYLGDGDIGKFAQGFMGVQGYVNATNTLINSTVNAQTYLGPTFTSMSDLVTNNLSLVNTDLPKFATDLANQGELTNLKNIELYGTPAGLLQQLSAVGNIQGGTAPALREKMLQLGMTNQNIVDLVNNNQFGLFNQQGLATNEFNSLQKLAYQAMTQVTGQDLLEVMDILDVTTANIATMADLINPTKVFPNSYQTMQTPTPNGAQPIYNPLGQVDMTLQNVVGIFLPSPSGCDELAKIIPPDQAVANKAVQASLQQISNIENTTLPALAETIQGFTRLPWDDTREYLANDVVADAPSFNGLAQLLPATQFYQAQDDVPAGTDITDTTYWQPTTLGGINTMAGLPLIEAQTSAIDSSVASFVNSNIATGTGPDGAITTCDVLGLAYDHNDFATRLNTATTAINALQTTITAGSFVVGQTYTIISVGTTNFIAIGASSNTIGVTFTATGVGSGTGTASQLAALNTAYTNILSAANDAAVITQITNANAAIAALSASPYVTTLNTAWTYMSNYLNLELGYQVKAGIDYFLLQPGEQTSVYAFVQSLSQYGRQCESCGPNQFLQEIADTTALGGQALVGSLREGENQMQLVKSSLANPEITLPPSTPPLDPECAVTPVT
jgi:hypothetical protein